MDDSTGRRRFIQLAGTGTALSLAGCNAFQSDGTNSTTNDGARTTDTGAQTTDSGTATDGSADGDSDTRRVTVQVQPDQEELQARQRELRSQLQEGEISNEEARAEAQRIRQELLSAATDAFESRDSGLTIDDSIEQFGVFLVSGRATALIDALAFAEVGSLFAAETFEQARAQAQSGQQTTTPTG
jgi:hypothetical protein